MMTLEEAVAWRECLRRKGQPLVVTNGCFDLIHRGHVQYLAVARQCGAALLVALNSDESVRAIKGPGRPVTPEQDRAYLLASLEAVDAVVVFTTRDATELLRVLAPDVYVKGGDYTKESLVREEYVLLKAMGVKIRIVPAAPGLSTTELIRRIRDESPA